MAQCRILQLACAKLKKESDEKDMNDKQEPASGPTPSPNKKLASEMEKKMKNLGGDTSLVRAT